MTMNSIRMTSSQLSMLKRRLLADADKESAAFLTAGFFEGAGGLHLTARNMLFPEEEDYTERTACRLEISPRFFNKAIGMAERDGVTLIISHSHPHSGGGLGYSQSDFAGECETSGTVGRCLGGRPMGSLLLGRGSLIGRVWRADGHAEPVDQIRIVDRHARIVPVGGTGAEPPPVDAGLYDRQIRAFGIGGQKTLSSIKVGIVGLGGTGSSVAEQLAREGVRRFTLVDHDVFATSNRTRMYGTDAGTKCIPKVELAGDNIVRILPGAEVERIRADVVSQEALASRNAMWCSAAPTGSGRDACSTSCHTRCSYPSLTPAWE